MSAVLSVTALGLTFALVLLRARLGIGGPAFTSVVQGAVRFNAYLGLAIVGTAYGASGLAVAALYLGVMVPLTNLIAVPVLSVYAAEKRPDVLRIVIDVAKNPLIIAFPFGILFNLVGGLPPWLERMMSMLGQASLPIALLCVGAGLNLAAVRTTRFLVAFAAILKLAVLPLLVWLACPAFGVTGEPRAVLTVFSALPAAPASYILARMMGGDAPLMAAMLTTQVALSAASLPAVLALLAAAGPPG
jgi:predicted permease